MYTYRATLVRVTDIDTFRMILDLGFYMSRIEQPYRLLRINGWEISTVKGKAGKLAVEAYLKGKSLIVMTQKPPMPELGTPPKADSFGRFLAEVYADTVNVSDWLVAEGHAQYQVYK